MLGPKKPAGAKPAVKKTTSRKKAAPAPTIVAPPTVVHEVLDVMPTPVHDDVEEEHG
jgi:hypothetical protein